MEASVVIVCFVDAEFHKVVDWVNLRSLCNELKKGVLVRKPLGFNLGRTEPTVETLVTLCSYSSWNIELWIFRDMVSNVCTICSAKCPKELFLIFSWSFQWIDPCKALYNNHCRTMIIIYRLIIPIMLIFKVNIELACLTLKYAYDTWLMHAWVF